MAVNVGAVATPDHVAEVAREIVGTGGIPDPEVTVNLEMPGYIQAFLFLHLSLENSADIL